MPEPDAPKPDPAPEPAPGRESRTRRGSRWRTLRRFVLGALVALLLVVTLGLLLLHTPSGRVALQAFVEKTAGTAAGGRLSFGSLDYRLWAGWVNAGNVRFTVEGTRLEIDEAQARWSPRGGLRVRIVRPRVVVRDTGKPKPARTADGLAARPWSALERFAGLELVDAHVELQDAKGVAYLVLEHADATMQEHEGGRPIRLAVRDGRLGPPGSQLAPLVGSGDLALEHGRLLIHALHLEARGSSVDLHGSLDRLEPNEGALQLSADADSALASSFARGIDVKGRLRAEADLTLKGSLSGTLRLSSPGLTLQGIGPWQTAARGRFDSGQVAIERAETLGYGGRIQVEGSVALGDQAQTALRLKAENLDVATLGGAVAKAELPIRSRLDASLSYGLAGWDLNRGHAEGELTLRALPAAVPERRSGAPGLPLAGSTKVSLVGRRLRLHDLRAEAHGALVAGEIAVSRSLELQGRYQVTLPLGSLPALLSDVGMRPPAWPFVGTLRAEGEIGGKAADPEATVRLSGEGIATAETARHATAAVEATARYASGRLALAPLLLRSSRGGQASFDGGVPLSTRGGTWDVTGVVDALDLGPALAVAGVDGHGPLNGRVRIDGPPASPTAHAELDARLELAGSPEPIRLSLAGSASGTRLAVERFDATLAGGRVQARGAYEPQTGAIQGSADADGLRAARLPMLPPTARRLDGVLAVSLTLSGTTDAPAGDAHGSVAQVTLDGSPLPGLLFAGHSDGRQFELSASSAADPARPEAGRAFLRGTGSLAGAWPLRVEIDAAALPLQQLLDAIPTSRRQGASAKAQGQVVIEVPLRAPGELRYSADGLSASGRVRDLEWRTDGFRVAGSAQEATIRGLHVSTTGRGPGTTPAGTLSIDGRVPIAPGRTFDLTVRGELDLAVLRASAPDERVAGQVQLDLRVGGNVASPELDGVLSVARGSGRYGSLRVSGVELLARLQGGQARIERAEARVLGGRVSTTGSVPIRRLEGGLAASLHFEAADVDLSRWNQPGTTRDSGSPSFLVSVVGDVEATAPAVEALRAHGRFVRLEQRSPEGTIALHSPAEWSLENGHFVQSPLRLEGPLGTLEARAEAQLGGASPSGSALVVGPFDLRLVGPFVQDTTLAGPTRVDLRASWDARGVRLDGSLTVENGRMTLEQLAFSASQIKGQVRLLGDRATIDATAVAGEGRIVASGGMTFGPRLLGPAQLALDVQRVPISYPEGFRARASGTLRVAGSPGAYRIGGEIGLTQAYYTAEFDRRKQSLDRLDWQLAALGSSQSLSDSLPLAVHVRLDEPLQIRNRQAQLDVVGSLDATGTLAQPLAVGQLSLVEGGRLTLRRAQVRAQQGRVELNGYPAGSPEVDFSGLSSVGGVDMEIHARGRLEDLQLEISSPNRPNLSQTDLLSLLLTGRTAQAAASQSTAIVAEELASALGGVLQKGIGETLLIDVAPDRSLLTDDSDPTQRFNIGTRLRYDLTVIYSSRLDGTERRWILDWNPRGGRLRLRAIDDETSGLAFEVTDRFSFNLFRRRRIPQLKAQESARLTALRITGEAPLAPDELRKASGLKIGSLYDALRREQAADRVRDLLIRRGWRGAAVDAESKITPGLQESLELELHVNAGPEVVVSWAGDDPGRKLRQQAAAAWPAYASPEAASAIVARAARIGLQSERYYEAKVEPELRVADGRAELVLNVRRGRKGTAVDVQFDGNVVLGRRALLATLPKPGSRAFFEGLDGRSGHVTGEARIAYARVGYLRARIGSPRQAFDATTGRLEVTFPVREGEPSRVGEIALPREVAEAGSGGPKLQLQTGQPFDVGAYVADRDAIANWFRAQGWSDARLRGVLEPTGGDVVVHFQAEPGPRPRVADVRIASEGRSHERLVRSAVVLEPGELITPRQLSLSRERLSELAIYRSVDVRAEPVEDRDDVRDVVVSYVERSDVDVEYGLLYNTSGAAGVGGAPSTPGNGRLQLAGALELANPFGWGWRFRPYAYLTRNRYNWGAALESASLFGLRVRTQLLGFDDRDNHTSIATLASRVRGFSVQQTRSLLQDTSAQRWHDRLRLQWGYTNKDIQYSAHEGGALALAGKRAFVNLSLIGDERESLTDPHRGVFWTATSELSRRALGSDADYVRLYGQFFAYLPLPGRMVWAQGYRAGVVPGTDPLLLLENRFQAGGPTTVRGYDQNDLGPQAEGGRFGGQAVIVLNQELRFPIWKQLAGGLYWDAGNVWALSRGFSVGDLRHSVGGGLRIMFPFGPIRLEYALVLGRRPGERAGRVVFGFGQAF